MCYLPCYFIRHLIRQSLEVWVPEEGHPVQGELPRQQDEWFTGVETIGVTSGASVPEILVKDVLATLREHGFKDVQEVTAAEESLLFALPPELRKDMKAAGQA